MVLAQSISPGVVFAEWTGIEVTLTAVIAALGGALTVIGPWIMQYMKTKSDLRKAAHDLNRVERADALAEWNQLTERQQKDLDRLQTKLDQFETRLQDCNKREAECERQHANTREKLAIQQGRVNQLESDVRRLQVIVRDAPPSVTVPCVMTVSAADGIVRAASPSSGPLLGWLPSELIGKNVNVLIPEELRAKHEKGLAEVASGAKITDPQKPIQTYALRRTGEKVAISVALTTWITPKGSTMINAEVRPVVQDVPTPLQRDSQ